MGRSIQQYLLATASVPMDLGYIPWASKGKGKGGKDKGHKGSKRQSKGQGKQQGRGNSEATFAGYCGKCGAWGHKQKNCWRQVNVTVEEVARLTATEENAWIYSITVSDRCMEETPSTTEENTWVEPIIGSDQCVEETPRATVEEGEEDSWIQPIIVDDRCVEETPVGEVSTSDDNYNVEAMVDSGASVCSPTDFRTIAIDTQTAVTKPPRCIDVQMGGNSECTGTSGYERSLLKPSSGCKSVSQH
eukprot:6473325-Amphidinium_carterae.2